MQVIFAVTGKDRRDELSRRVPADRIGKQGCICRRATGVNGR